jgi:hypothetical protein
MKVEKAGLEFGVKPELKLDDNAVYLIDFTKITSVNDLVLILASVGFSFSPRHPHFNNIKPFLALDNPIPTNQPILPKKEELQLPKLKSLK